MSIQSNKEENIYITEEQLNLIIKKLFSFNYTIIEIRFCGTLPGIECGGLTSKVNKPINNILNDLIDIGIKAYTPEEKDGCYSDRHIIYFELNQEKRKKDLSPEERSPIPFKTYFNISKEN